MKKVIVTGANGFIGTALCKELTKQNIEVIAVVKDEKADILDIELLNRIRIVYCDLSAFRNLAQIILDRDIDILYHFAWIGSAGSMRGDSDIQLANVKYTCDTVKACKDMRCKRFVFASSLMEYEIEAFMETDMIPEVNTLYSSAKLAADYMARTLAGSMGLDYIRAVISNIYGPGELSSRLINTSIRKMLDGEHCAFSPAEQAYDFIYITDAVEAFIAIGEKGIANKAYYIGSRQIRPLKEFLYDLRDQIDPSIEIGIGEIPFNGVSLTYTEFDIHAVKNDTGFIPQIGFKEGIKNTVAWIKENRKCQILNLQK